MGNLGSMRIWTLLACTYGPTPTHMQSALTTMPGHIPGSIYKLRHLREILKSNRPAASQHLCTPPSILRIRIFAPTSTRGQRNRCSRCDCLGEWFSANRPTWKIRMQARFHGRAGWVFGGPGHPLAPGQDRREDGNFPQSDQQEPDFQVPAVSVASRESSL